MKRQHKSWLIAVLAVLAAAMVLTGCSLKEVKSLTITNPPATTYEVGTTPTIDFTVKAVMDDDTTKTLTYDEYKSVLKLTGFSTEEVGTFTATITYRNVSVTFDYEVVPSGETGDFAGGVGTETNPYIINTVEQFLKIGEEAYSSKYFKLSADLDFTNYIIDSETTPYYITSAWPDFPWYSHIGCFSGTLDGNGYKIMNVKASEEVASGFFTLLENATIKNLSYYSEGGVSLGVMSKGNTLFENVDCYGSAFFTGGNNQGAFLTYNDGALTMINCDNYMNLLGVSSYVGGFIGQPSWSESLTMIDCNNYGKITGIKAAAFFANANNGAYTKNITMTNCHNYGEIIGTENSALFFATTAVLGDDYYVKATNCTAEVEPIKLLKNDGYSTSVAADGKITVTQTEREGAQVAKVIVTVTYMSNNGKDSTLLLGTQEELVFTATETSMTTEVVRKIQVKAGTLEEGKTTWETIVEENGVYYYIHDNTSLWPNASGSVTVNVMAFDAEGNLVAGGQI